MFPRSISLTRASSFFLFGARGTGKSTLLHRFFGDAALSIDLLDADQETRFSRRPQLLAELASSLPAESWVLLDEIQRVPRLLDVVHSLIENASLKFALTGSSARKLKRGGANLLAGRAFVYHLYPLTSLEMGTAFDLDAALNWGTLPLAVNLGGEQDKAEFLKAYAQTYIREEIVAEQVVRQLQPFRHFLELAAQADGQIVSYSTIARQVGVDHKTVASYYQILEDTLLGFTLPAFSRSVRVRQRQSPKFYLFDGGVSRAINGQLRVPLRESSYVFGTAFESFVIRELVRLADYGRLDHRFYYLRTPAGVEVDLIIERPGKPLALVEIKSTREVTDPDLKALRSLLPDLAPAKAYCLSRDPLARTVDGITCMPWLDGVKVLSQA